MPSDDRGNQVFQALTDTRAAFRSAVVSATGEIEAYLASHRAPRDGRGRQVAAELGVFAAGRIDADRFAALLTDDGPLDAGTASLLERAQTVLRELTRAGDALFRVDVPSGTDVVAAVDGGLASAGRAFGAARVAELARTGRAALAAKEDPAGPRPFGQWNRAERDLGFPLVVEVDGGDLVAGGLAAFLDGRQKIALVVREPASPAPLARLITPGVFVMQTTDVADFERFVAFEGPAIAALVPEGCARFLHDPAAGSSPADRITVLHVPEDAPRRAIGRSSVFAQTEELAHLAALAAAGAGGGTLAGTAAATGDGSGAGPNGAGPADVLAAWLLQQADLSDVGA